MGVVVQELVGTRRGRWYYPHVSGTAQSHNYYPVGRAQERGRALRIGPRASAPTSWAGPRPTASAPSTRSWTSCPPSASSDARSACSAPSTWRTREPDLLAGDEAALRELDIAEAEADPRFGLLASTWDAENDRLSPGVGAPGPRVVDLANILKHEALPFAEAIDMVLDIGAALDGHARRDRVRPQPRRAGRRARPLPPPAQAPHTQRGQGGRGHRGRLDRAECFILSDRSMGNGRDAASSGRRMGRPAALRQRRDRRDRRGDRGARPRDARPRAALRPRRAGALGHAATAGSACPSPSPRYRWPASSSRSTCPSSRSSPPSARTSSTT